MHCCTFLLYVASVLYVASIMAEQPPTSGARATDCEDFVRIPRMQYMQAVVQIRQQKSQLIAASNLHRLMQDKEKEMMACKDKNEQLQLALQQTEARLSSVIRLQAATGARNNLEEDDAIAAVGIMPSDVEPDGESVTRPPHCSPLHSSIAKLAEKPTNKTVMTLGSSVTEIPITFTSASSPRPSVDAPSSFTDTCPAHLTCSASSVTVPSLPASSYITSLPISSISSVASSQSKDLLDKVLQQNARLKKTLRDFLSQKGLSVSMYLVCNYIGKMSFGLYATVR